MPRINKCLFASLLITGGLFSCSEVKSKKEEPVVETPVASAPVQGTIESKVSPNGSSYSVYIPVHKANESLPAMIFFDPHANGNVPLKKYKGLSDKFGIILVGSNEIKNGLVFERITQLAEELYNVTISNLPVANNNIGLAGFSGGAKAALVCGSSLDFFNCIIYCGAALPAGSVEIKKPLLGFAGKKDMNYTEVLDFNKSIKPGIEHAIAEWNGKHDWPDSADFQKAFYWQSIIALKKSGKKNDTLVNEYLSFIKNEIKNSSSALKKVNLYTQEIVILDKFADIDKPMKELASLLNSPEFKNANVARERMLAEENKRKEIFMSSFESRELAWWNDQIKLLQNDSAIESNPRLLGYISLASWSYSTKAIATNNLVLAQKALSIYKLADPENSEQPFLQACLHCKKQENDSALIDLNEAVKLGFNDRNKVENEKDLFALRGRNEFNDILSKMH